MACDLRNSLSITFFFCKLIGRVYGHCSMELETRKYNYLVNTGYECIWGYKLRLNAGELQDKEIK